MATDGEWFNSIIIIYVFCLFTSYHADKVVKTGGGFTYFKKDRPSKEISSKNPSNWKIHDPSRTLKRLMEGKLCL